MRRSPSITWDQLRVGLVIGVAVLVVGIAIYKLGQAANLFTTRTGLSTLVSPRFTPGVFAWGLAFALGVGLLGAAYPTWRALSLSPIEALRRE